MIKRTVCRRAIALVVVVYIVAALGMLSFALAFRSRVAIKETSFLAERIQQDQIARAVCAQAFSILAAGNNSVNSFDESWCGWHETIIDQQVEDVAGIQSDVWEIHWKLTDESGKININLASVDLLSGLECLDEAAVASIADWLDQDDVPGPDGAENDYYSGLEFAYGCKNGPIDDIEELLLIKGISPQVYYGSRLYENSSYLAEQDVDSDDRDYDGVPVGLCDLLTIYGDGRININTAPKGVLDALPILSEAAVNEIVSRQNSNSLKFSSAEDIQNNDNFNAADKLMLMQVAKFNSNHFQLCIRIYNKEKLFRCEYTAVVERDGVNVNLLSWQRKPPVMLKDIAYFSAGIS